MRPTLLTFIFTLLGTICFSQDSSFTHYNKFLTGKIQPGSTHFFKYFNENGRDFYLQKDAYLAYKQMRDAAKEEGVNLNLVSAGRTFNYQKGIWERKFKACYNNTADTLLCVKQLLNYSAMPGTSRHHWGTEIDINAVNFAYFESPYGKKVYNWLHANASTFGFCQVYDPLSYSHRTGYNEEPWHWSFLPLASKYLLDYNERIEHSDLKDFSGAQFGDSLSIKSDFVNGIGFICK